MTKKNITVEVGSLGIEYSSAESVIEELTGYVESYGGEYTQRELGVMFDIHSTNIGRVIREVSYN